MFKIVASKLKKNKVIRRSILSKFFVINPLYLKGIINPEMHSDFCRDILTLDMASKMTSLSRFKNLNDALLPFIKTKRIISIHDVAVSNGITSLELYDFLKKNNIKFSLDISDKYNFYHVYMVSNHIQFFLDEDKNVSFVIFFGIYFNKSLSNFFFFSKYVTLIFTYLWSIYDYFFAAIKKNITINLFYPSVWSLIKSRKISYFRYDVFNSVLKEKYDVVRCMNILILKYFSDSQIRVALHNLKESLRENGLLIIGRTSLDGVNHVSIYKKKKGGMILVHVLGEGSELNSYIG